MGHKAVAALGQLSTALGCSQREASVSMRQDGEDLGEMLSPKAYMSARLPALRLPSVQISDIY